MTALLLGMDPADARRTFCATSRMRPNQCWRKGGRCGVSDPRRRECLGVLSETGREFLRRFTMRCSTKAVLRVTVSERFRASQRVIFEVSGAGIVDQRKLQCLDRGSGRYRAWDYLHHAREFYAQHSPGPARHNENWL